MNTVEDMYVSYYLLFRPNRTQEEALAEFTKEDGDVLVAEDPSTLLGFVRVLPQPEQKWHIQDIWVEEKHRRRGVAALLMTQVVQKANEAGFQKLTAEVWVSNHESQALMGRFQFLKEGENEDGVMWKYRRDLRGEGA